ncbi:MAG: lamin tail domain-containing protein, partial [Myxococcota bacterium]|nr:lamin tail domain-containing protein [Myxococcota bacterium]
SGPASLLLHNTIVANGFGPNVLPGDAALAGETGAQGIVRNNILVGNEVGLSCQDCDLDAGYGLIWGNEVDYAGEASPAPSDLGLDPRFRSPGERDWRLLPDSPAIDAADLQYSLAHDRDGESRLLGAGSDLGMDEFRSSSLSIAITEVMAQPLVENTGEFIELLNLGTTGVELSGLLVSDGDETEPLLAWNGSPTLVGPGAFALIVDAQFAGQYDIPAWVPVLTTLDLDLGDGLSRADPVRLFEPDGGTLVSTYSFPVDAGTGIAVERSRPSASDRPENWVASACPSGSSPGTAGCFDGPLGVEHLVLTEVLAQSGDDGVGEFIELYNAADQALVLDYLLLRNSLGEEELLISPTGGEVIIPAQSHALVVDTEFTASQPLPPGTVLLGPASRELGQGLSLSGGFSLLAPEGETVLAVFNPAVTAPPGVSVEKLGYAGGDQPANWERSDGCCNSAKSPARLNGVSGGVCGTILVTEVMTHPAPGGIPAFVEVFNDGSDPVNLSSLVLDDGDHSYLLSHYPGRGSTLQPGDYGLIVDEDASSLVALPEGVPLAVLQDTLLDTALSSEDPVRLLDSDGSSLVDGFLWPFQSGQGRSIERSVLRGAPASAGQWLSSPCASGSSPGSENCAGTGGMGTAESELDLLITEVMHNPFFEASGEFVEIYNRGDVDIELAGLLLWDGDAADSLVAFDSQETTVLSPGGFALVLDGGFNGDYLLPPDLVLLTTEDQALGSGLAGDDPVVLFEPDFLTVVDSYSWPVSVGDGVSVERLVLDAPDGVGNWAPSPCGASPGQLSCGGD